MVEKLLEDWSRHRSVLEELLKPVADEHYDFKPWDGAMSLGEMALHIVQWADTFVTLVKTGEFTMPADLGCNTMSEVRDAVRELTEKTTATLKTITNTDVETERVFSLSGFRAQGKLFLDMLYDHEVHHKGQLYIYVRMLGYKEVPFFRKR